jgi:sulfatase modifying factor 1
MKIPVKQSFWKTALLVTTTVMVWNLHAQNYSVDWHEIGGGGGVTTNVTYQVSGSIGQPDANSTMSGTVFSVTGGFWSFIVVVQMSGAPLLTISCAGNSVIIFWPLDSDRFELQQNDDLLNSGGWSKYGGTVSTNNGVKSITIIQPTGNLFFRLSRLPSSDMVLIPAGSFVMGACTNVGQESWPESVPQHSVTINAFFMDKYEVTSDLWRDVYTWATNKGYAFANVGSAKTNNHPVQTVNWYDCVTWCNARSERDGFTPCYTNENGTVYTNSMGNSFIGGCNWEAGGYRLPTEAEWEKAARGGVANRRFPWNDADTIQHARANYNAHTESIAYDTSPTTGFHPSSGTWPHTMAAGSFAANGYGLYDMAGNVYEWCWDWFDAGYYSTPSATNQNPSGPTTGTYRVLRGGAAAVGCNALRVSCRGGYYPDYVTVSYGFRCARGL